MKLKGYVIHINSYTTIVKSFQMLTLQFVCIKRLCFHYLTEKTHIYLN